MTITRPLVGTVASSTRQKAQFQGTYYATTFGGTTTSGYGQAIAVDSSGNIYVAGTQYTTGTTVGFISKFSSDGSTLLSTKQIIPANLRSGGYYATPSHMVIDANDNIYLCGNFWQASPLLQASFVYKFDTSLNYVSGKLFTASGNSQGRTIATIDSSTGNIAVGMTMSNSGASTTYTYVVIMNSSLTTQYSSQFYISGQGAYLSGLTYDSSGSLFAWYLGYNSGVGTAVATLSQVSTTANNSVSNTYSYFPTGFGSSTQNSTGNGLVVDATNLYCSYNFAGGGGLMAINKNTFNVSWQTGEYQKVNIDGQTASSFNSFLNGIALDTVNNIIVGAAVQSEPGANDAVLTRASTSGTVLPSYYFSYGSNPQTNNYMYGAVCKNGITYSSFSPSAYSGGSGGFYWGALSWPTTPSITAGTRYAFTPYSSILISAVNNSVVSTSMAKQTANTVSTISDASNSTPSAPTLATLSTGVSMSYLKTTIS